MVNPQEINTFMHYKGPAIGLYTQDQFRDSMKALGMVRESEKIANEFLPAFDYIDHGDGISGNWIFEGDTRVTYYFFNRFNPDETDTVLVNLSGDKISEVERILRREELRILNE